MNQNQTPLFDAVKKHIEREVIPFHVPGHKHGNGISEFREFVGDNVLKMDLNSMSDIDDACNPIGVIAESQKLFAEAYGAEHAYFLVNGSSSGIQTMIMSACKPGDQIILPRNAHKSALSGIILSGAVPVYVQPEINEELGIAMGITEVALKNAIKKHPHAKAVFVVNPTYYGVSSDIKSIVKIARKNNMAVLIDEAHGAHMPFHKDFPLTAMEVGADMSTVSTHKTGGSLTQSAALLLRSNIIKPEKVRQILNLTYTTSASYLLMSSIDVARKQLATKGFEMLDNVLKLARKAREDINKIEGLYSPGKELIGTTGCYDFDETKLTVNIKNLGLTGYEMENILVNDYNIQIEFADLFNIFLIITLGDKEEYIDALVKALKEIAQKRDKKAVNKAAKIPFNPEMIISPREAFYSQKKTVALEDSEGEICGEMIMAYPPGIPVISMGERISKDVIDYVKILKKEKCQLQGTSDPYVNNIRVIAKPTYLLKNNFQFGEYAEYSD
ncbi:MAG: aminotransferase class I/II-fold pyridoxal phosphate-dependent enzyme [Deltaproteobacteria bacterium]